MSMKLIAKLRAERDALKTETIEPVLQLMEAGEQVTDAQRESLAAADTEMQRLDAQIASLSEMQTRRLDAAQRDSELDRRAEQVARGTVAEALDRAPTRFAATAAGMITELGGKTGVITVPRAALSVIDNRDAGGAPLAGVTRVREAPEPVTITPLLDATMKQPVASDDYDWEEWGRIPVAGSVPAAEGSLKPAADDGYTIHQGVLGTIAHHIGVSRRALQDRAGLEARISSRLLRGVDLRAEELTALALTSGTYEEAAHTGGLLQSIRVAMAMVQDAGFSPTHLVINPLDQAHIDISLLELAPGPGALAGRSVWQIPTIVPTSKVPEGRAYVGSIFDALLTSYRAEAQIYVTDSHADEFIRNRVRILAEQRLSVDLQQPAAIVAATVAP